MSVRRVCMWGYDFFFFSKNVSYCGLLGPFVSGGKKIVHLSAADIRNSRGNGLFDVTAISSLKVELLF